MGFYSQRQQGGGGIGCNGRVIAALIVVAFSLVSYYGYRSVNPVTGEKQHVKMSVEQEVAIGLQAAPEMAAQFGGLSQDHVAQQQVEAIGQRIVSGSDASKGEYTFAFHVLTDPQTINAFALPGGQVFMTAGLLTKLQTEGQVAGVLAHEIGHVVGRHSAEHVAKAELMQGLTGAAVIATYDPNNPNTYQNAAFAAMIAQLVNLKFGRNDELEADRLGVRFMTQSGYDPRAMIAVMEVLEKAAGGGREPDFFSTHPNPERRISRIEQAIAEQFPNGVPKGLKN